MRAVSVVHPAAAALAAVALASCASSHPLDPATERASTNPSGPPSSTIASTDSALPGCVDVKEPTLKDLAPCVQECDRGIASACSTLASRVERGVGFPRDMPRAVQLHERACELRDASECVAAARMHASGAGVSPNRARQMELLAAACNLGDASACSVPAKAYLSGTGVSRDEHKARALLERACTGGVESACDSLGDAGP